MEFDHFNMLCLVGVCFATADNLPSIVLPFMVNGDLRSFLRTKRAAGMMAKEDYPEVGLI